MHQIAIQPSPARAPRHLRHAWAALLALALAVSACGGGGGGGGGGGTPAPPPVPKAWTGAVLLETNDMGTAVGADVALDANGNAVAVWQQSDGTRFNIWANRYNASTSAWGTATLIETDNAGAAFKPHAANRKLFPDQHRQIRPADQHIPAQNSGRNPRQSKLRLERFKHVRGEKRDLSFVAGTIPVKPIPFDAPTRAADDRRHLSRRMFAGGRTRSAEKIMTG